MTNLVETIQKNLQYPCLQQIDPRIQDIQHKEEIPELGLLAQAAIPAVLAGLFRLSRKEEGCLQIINEAGTGDSLAILFKGCEGKVIESVAHYSGLSANQAESHLENIADESIRLTRLVSGDSPDKLKQYMQEQRQAILVHLPASLDFGDTLNEGPQEDRINKMGGPVSDFVH